MPGREVAAMPQPVFERVDEYIDAQPPAMQRILTQVRDAIRKAVPDAEETIAYNMPTYKLRGKRLLHFAAWKAHYSVYPANERLMAAFKNELQPYKVEQGTLRFELTDPVPVDLIERIATFRAGEIA